MLKWVLLLTLWSFAIGCLRQPSVYHSRVAKLQGDNGYRIKLQDDLQKYVPGDVYTVHILGSRTFGKIQYFQRFTLNIESNNDPGNISPQKVGTFQLFGDNLSKFNEDCVNTISETNNLPKTEVSFLWKAPPSGSGCVTFRAMVLEDFSHWFADDGELSKTVCEITDKDVKFDEGDCCACDEAKYNLIFEGIWSNITHPKDFPFSLWLTHLSDVIGGSHERNFTFWGVGQIASEGFRSLAEWGSVRLLESELRAKSKHLRSIIKAAGLWYPKVNSNTTTTFKVDRKHHLVSMASMIGPSPDWVVGVNGLNLCLKNCTWIEDLTVDLFPYDAGTDSGISYMSPNAETLPRERMYRITTKYPEDPRAPFYDAFKDDMNPIARFYFKRDKLIPKSCDESFLTAQLEVSENTEDTSRPECAVTDYTNWSPCSVTCGKGLSMRTREYILPQKAKMFQCNRQLVSKEMCVAAIPECAGGEENEVDSEEKLEENEGICATSAWTPWSECSATCGPGFISRTRHFIDIMGRKKCPHVNIFEREKCMGPQCVEVAEAADPMCPVTEWSDWSPCSASCGKGVKLRTRLLLVDPGLQEKCSSRVEMVQQRPCVDTPDCTFDIATAKEVCMHESLQGPCTGHFNRWYFEPNKLMCVPFVYGGCRGNRNNFLTAEECNESCKVVKEALIESRSGGAPAQNPSISSNNGPFDMATAKEVCMQESHQGPCRDNLNRWYFESRKLMCVPFIYGGCQGNRNNFLTAEECNNACKIVRDALTGTAPQGRPSSTGVPSEPPFDMATAKEVCMLESDAGSCNRNLNRWYFEQRKFMCVPFIYGGCQGNRNNFESAEKCNEACKIVRDLLIGSNPNIPVPVNPPPRSKSSKGPVDMATAKAICMREVDEGPCFEHHNRWYFESRKLMCVPFVYGGCQGNENNFETAEECSSVCNVVREALSGTASPGKTAVGVPSEPPFDMATAKEVCMQESDSGPCNKNLNRWYFEQRKFMCVPFIYGGCQGNRNNFETAEKCTEACKVVRDLLIGNSPSVPQPFNPPSSIPKSRGPVDMATAKAICMRQADAGPCFGNHNRWYFESRKLMCVPFVYGGCQGNENNFETVEECNSVCKVVRDALTGPPPPSKNTVTFGSEPPADMASAKEICMQENKPGPCRQNLNRWYFEPRKLMCVPFIYGGCQGNRNNFETAEKCNIACNIVRDALLGNNPNIPVPVNTPAIDIPKGKSQVDIATAKATCMQEAEEGPCKGKLNRWYFESRKLMCVPFVYGGCQGNENNFLTSEECNETCKVVRDALIGTPTTPTQAVTPASNSPFDLATSKRICMQDNVRGSCGRSLQRYYFDSRKLMCVPFIYSGCEGNSNNFLSAEDCNRACSVIRDSILGNVSNSPVQHQPPPSFSGNDHPVDCAVSEWSDWSPCSATCGTGFNERTRTITRVAANGGIPCPKRLQKRMKCNVKPCN